MLTDTQETSIPYTYTVAQQTALLVVGMLSWVSWPYCFDIPQGVQTQLKQPPYNLHVSEFNNFYVVASLPNVILSFVSGWITLKFGISNSILMYALLLLIGQSLVAASVWQMFEGWYPVMLLGRFLLGFSGCGLTSANLSLIPRYTSKKLVSLFVGIGSMVPWTSQSLCDLLTPIIYDQSGRVEYPFIAGWIIGVFSMILALCLFVYTRYLDRMKPASITPR